MNCIAMADSIVEYFGGDSDGHRCGYCKSPNTNFSHGMWAHRMTCLDYQDLIDRGWRRSGKYVYKPTMKKLCCPMYTIKCDAVAFQPSKSQKKVLKKMTKFLTIPKTGPSSSHDKDTVPSESLDSTMEHFVEPSPGKLPSFTLSKSHFAGKNSSGERQLPKESASPSFSGERTSNPVEAKTGSKKGKTPAPGVGPDPTKPPCEKAKVLRLERKKQKLALAKEKGISELESILKTPKASATKSLEDLIMDRLPNQLPVHDLQIKLVLSDPNDVEFQQSFPKTAELFFKYQRVIHKDPPEKCTQKRFKRFLVDSPLQHYTGPGSPPMGFGSFHQQYFIDGKLVAVGVIDILPRCVSSVYFFYDPDFSFLSPGVYSALRELHFTRSLQRTTPSIKSYYMGFYIHSCPKMKYKGRYNPSYLVCPESYEWIPIEQCIPKLDYSRYARLDDSNREPPKGSIVNVVVLFKRETMSYRMYQLISRARDSEEVQEYAELVGPVVASRMLLYRSD
ncbi:arginyl-tRNA--protein transferase 1-like isoform X2 [Acropora muricata]|uniref:arginyl-tRNA--protein transferase 1-like isoform X2 n=1 Tax=Acropora muricata TaxID=159855 RepID=UPI0034E50826